MDVDYDALAKVFEIMYQKNTEYINIFNVKPREYSKYLKIEKESKPEDHEWGF